MTPAELRRCLRASFTLRAARAAVAACERGDWPRAFELLVSAQMGADWLADDDEQRARDAKEEAADGAHP